MATIACEFAALPGHYEPELSLTFYVQRGGSLDQSPSRTSKNETHDAASSSSHHYGPTSTSKVEPRSPRACVWEDSIQQSCFGSARRCNNIEACIYCHQHPPWATWIELVCDAEASRQLLQTGRHSFMGTSHEHCMRRDWRATGATEGTPHQVRYGELVRE
jgi:hypothetical protein